MNTAVMVRYVAEKPVRGPERAPAEAHALSLKPPSIKPKCRTLLALDGMALTEDKLIKAEQQCRQFAGRVDILLVNPPKAPTMLLYKLLVGLEQADIDYRLTSTHGSLGEEIALYLKRHHGISLVMVDSVPSLGPAWGINAANLRYQGYRLMPLTSEPPASELDRGIAAGCMSVAGEVVRLCAR